MELTREERLEKLRKVMDAKAEAWKESEPSPLSRGDQWRRFGSTSLFFLGVTALLIIAVDIWNNVRGWIRSAGDPSARDAYKTFMEIDVALVVLTLFVLFVGTRLLRKRAPV
jgi:hypothetical protein